MVNRKSGSTRSLPASLWASITSTHTLLLSLQNHAPERQHGRPVLPRKDQLQELPQPDSDRTEPGSTGEPDSEEDRNQLLHWWPTSFSFFQGKPAGASWSDPPHPKAFPSTLFL